MKYLQQARRRLELLSNKAVQAARAGSEVPKSGVVTLLKKPLDVVLRLTYGALEGGSRMRKYNVLAEQLWQARAVAVNSILLITARGTRGSRSVAQNLYRRVTALS